MSLLMIDFATIYSYSDYRELILSVLLWIREALFSGGGGIGIILKGMAWLMHYPLEVAIGTFTIYGLIVRCIGIKLYHKAGLIDIRKSLIFFPSTLIWGFLWSYLVISIADTSWIYLLIWLALLLIGLSHFVPMRWGEYIFKSLSNYRYSSVLLYLLMTISDTLTVVVWWWGLIQNYIFKHFYGIGALESAGIRKISMFGRSISTIITFVRAGAYDLTLLWRCIILGIPAFVRWTHYMLRKWESRAEMIVWYMSLILVSW